MQDLRTTVVMKADLRGYTETVVAMASDELRSYIRKYGQLIVATATGAGGTLLKNEGDASWLTFPSVTSAALAAGRIHEELRATQTGHSPAGQVAARIVITLGDLLHQEGDLFGEAMNLAARIEKVTPPEETYLSLAAWAALNRAEVRSSYVNEFVLKGFAEPMAVYRADHQPRTRTARDQVMAMSDVLGFTQLQTQQSAAVVEEVLLQLDALHAEICEEYGGSIRMVIGDGYLLTFRDPKSALAALERACARWDEFTRERKLQCPVRYGIHVGEIHVFRSFLYSKDINVVARLEGVSRSVLGRTGSGVLASGLVKEALVGCEWEARLVPVEAPQHWAEWERASHGVFRLEL